MSVSFWFDELKRSGTDDLAPRAAIGGDLEVDVAIVGAGLTGLWTAYYLLANDPGLRIAVLEKHFAGWGASGRNGGWCSALFPQSPAALEARYGRDGAVRMRQAMVDTIGHVERETIAAGIDCDFARGGTVAFVRSRPQLRAARAEVAETARLGVDTLSLWGSERVFSQFGAAGAVAATFTPDCARIQPAKLVRGLARAVEQRGATIYENSAVQSWVDGKVEVTAGSARYTVRADVVVNATEGYGAAVPQLRRTVLPLYSLMIATEPLPEEVWNRIGIEHGQTFTDFRHLLIYGQRTADNRFAFGGRGARYHLGSTIDPDYDRVPHVARHLHRALVELFPDAAGSRVTHHWGGPIGVPRDWHASVGYHPETREAWAGGYVGDGVATTNLAGRTLADLLTGTRSDLTALPWVGHRSPRWEPEPLRFAAANAGLLGMQLADVEERATRHPSLIARVIGPFTGH